MIKRIDVRLAGRAAVGLCAAYLLLLTLAGCAGSGVRVETSLGTTAVPVDCSESVRGQQRAWDRQIATIASEVLAREERLLVGCFVGRVTGVKWLPSFRGDALPAMTGGAAGRRRAEVAWGLSLEPLFRRELRVQGIPGTDWLSALHAASEISKLTKVYLFSDLVQQAEGIELANELSHQQLAEIAQSWAPRLSGLRGKTVVEIGGGEKLVSSPSDDQGVALLEELGRLVGFSVEPLSTLS